MLPTGLPYNSQILVHTLQSVQSSLSRNVQPCLKLVDKISPSPPSPSALAAASIQRPFPRSASFSIAGSSSFPRPHTYPMQLRQALDDSGLRNQSALLLPRSRASTEIPPAVGDLTRYSIIETSDTSCRDISFSDIMASSRPSSMLTNYPPEPGGPPPTAEEELLFLFPEINQQFSLRILGMKAE